MTRLHGRQWVRSHDSPYSLRYYRKPWLRERERKHKTWRQRVRAVIDWLLNIELF